MELGGPLSPEALGSLPTLPKVKAGTALTSLFNYSLQEKVVPSTWKRSHITPKYKGGASDDPSNYRPIAVVPVVAKVLEKIVSTQLSMYLEKNNLLYCAYRSGKSKQPSCKKGCSLQECCCEKRCEIQSGGQEMAVIVG